MDVMDAHPKDKILIKNPRIPAFLYEVMQVEEFVKKATPLIAAMEDANADLGIAMWQRCRHLIREAKHTQQEKLIQIGKMKERLVEVDPYNIDQVIDKLDPSLGALQLIGSYLGVTTVVSAYEIARIEHMKPSTIMASFLKQITSARDQLDEQLAMLVKVEVNESLKSSGKCASGRYTLKLGEKYGDPIYAVRRD